SLERRVRNRANAPFTRACPLGRQHRGLTPGQNLADSLSHPFVIGQAPVGFLNIISRRSRQQSEFEWHRTISFCRKCISELSFLDPEIRHDYLTYSNDQINP